MTYEFPRFNTVQPVNYALLKIHCQTLNIHKYRLRHTSTSTVRLIKILRRCENQKNRLSNLRRTHSTELRDAPSLPGLPGISSPPCHSPLQPITTGLTSTTNRTLIMMTCQRTSPDWTGLADACSKVCSPATSTCVRSNSQSARACRLTVNPLLS